MQLNYTLDPYRRLYLPDDVAALRTALNRLRGNAPEPASSNPTQSSERTSPMSKARLAETLDLGCGLLGCIVQMYECMATTHQVATAMELSLSDREPPHDRSKHPEIVRSLGKDVEDAVKRAIVDNAHMLTHYADIHIIDGGRPSILRLSTDTVQHWDSAGDHQLNRKA
jgi:hypothetical protein